jgi:UDP-N-acetylmuramoyl-tripeptide--D-alanyl-D-alanine ligase
MEMRLAEIVGSLRALTATANLDSAALRVVTGISTDTRTLAPGDLYIALRGENFDGHRYMGEAFKKGAVAAIADSPVDLSSFPESPLVIQTKDSLAALGDIARAWRRKFDIPVIAVTGSVGKTSVKEMIACALSSLGPIVKTDRNENNEIGLPKTLLRLSSEHKAAVVEIGMRGKGQITNLAQIAEPTVGIITMIGESHIELLGSRDAIAAAKAELFEELSGSDATAVYNLDGDYAQRLATAAHCKILTFGGLKWSGGDDDQKADFRLLEASRDSEGWSGVLSVPDGSPINIHVATPARHDLVNATGAIAAAYAAGVAPEVSANRILEYSPGAMRMETLSGKNGVTILSDCYNAAPSSMKAALDTLADSGPESARKLAFLGDMKELGGYAQSMHEEVIDYAISKGIDELYLVGEEFGKLPKRAVRRFENSEDAARFAESGFALSEGDVVLIKGSRSMEMERIVEALKE